MENTPQALTELVAVNDLMVRSKEFKSFLVNPRFTSDERASVIKLLSEKMRFSEGTIKFILYLSEIGATIALPDIIRIATNSLP